MDWYINYSERFCDIGLSDLLYRVPLVHFYILLARTYLVAVPVARIRRNVMPGDCNDFCRQEARVALMCDHQRPNCIKHFSLSV